MQIISSIKVYKVLRVAYTEFMKFKLCISLFTIFLITGCGQSLEKDSLRQISEGSVIGTAGIIILMFGKEFHSQNHLWVS